MEQPHDLASYKAAFEQEQQARIYAEKALDEKTREITNSLMVMKQQYENLLKNKSELEQAQQQLLQSEKMASLGQLSAGVAHEINNPISFILLNLDSLKEYLDTLITLSDHYEQHLTSDTGQLPSELESFKEEQDISFIKDDLVKLYDDSKDGLARVKDIVANLKNFARADEGEYELADINDCIENTIKVVWNEIKHNATLTKNLGSIPNISFNQNQLSQVFMNLLVNACHAIKDQKENGEITLSTFTKNSTVYISIKDDGCGIPKEIQSKIFDPFFTTKDVDTGTGLGLSISYGIIEKHHGKIDLISSPSNGSEFIIQLPVPQ